MAMTEEIKANRVKWLEALKSGKYKQTTGKLKSHGRYCCLGVWGKISTWDNCNFNNEYLSDAGLKSLNMTVAQADKATQLNDGADDGYYIVNNKSSTFKEIEAYFRKIWKIHKE